MTESAFTPAELASIDQMHAGAMELARTIAGQWKVYMDAGIPQATAHELVFMYHRAVTEDRDDHVCPLEDDD